MSDTMVCLNPVKVGHADERHRGYSNSKLVAALRQVWPLRPVVFELRSRRTHVSSVYGWFEFERVSPHFSLFNSVHTFEYGTRRGTAACFSPAQRLRLNDRIMSPQLTETVFIEVVQARPVEIKQQQMTVVRVYKGRPHAALTVQYYVPSRTTTF